jgi:hypothetical protein
MATSLAVGSVLAEDHTPAYYFALSMDKGSPSIGNHWRYLTVHDTTEHSPDRHTFIDVVDTTTFGIPGETLSYRIEESENLFGHPDTSTYRTMFYTYNEGGDLCISGGMIGDSIVVFDPLAVYLRNPITVGDSSHLSADGYEVVYVVESISDTLYTTLGFFENCLRLFIKTWMDGQPHSEEYEYYIPTAYWPVSGLGRRTKLKWHSYPDSSQCGGTYIQECSVFPPASIPDGQTSEGNLPCCRIRWISPNPLGATATIGYSVRPTGHVTLRLFNALGQRVQTVLSDEILCGEHEFYWNAQDLQSGVYYLRIEAGGSAESAKLILLK